MTAQLINVHQSTIYFNPNFFTGKLDIIDQLKTIDDWKGQSKFDKDNGNWIPPRLQRWSHMDGHNFHSKWDDSLDRWKHHEYTDWLLEFQSLTQEALIPIFELMPSAKIPNINSILLNNYLDGSNSISLHQDVIPEFGHNPTVILASFGATRRFNILHVERKDKSLIPIPSEHNYSFDLQHGSLLIMGGECQQHFAHAIPKDLNITEQRFSCVLREHH